MFSSSEASKQAKQGPLGGIHKLRWQGKGREGYPNVNDTTEAYVVNLLTKGGGGVKNSENPVNVVYGCPPI